VLLDMRMPELDGAAVLCVLRQEAPELPVILVSGLLEPRRREALLAAGARLFLAKPYTDEQLLEALHRVLPPRA
jgi:CheY-like chemotaxis protein